MDKNKRLMTEELEQVNGGSLEDVAIYNKSEKAGLRNTVMDDSMDGEIRLMDTSLVNSSAKDAVSRIKRNKDVLTGQPVQQA